MKRLILIVIVSSLLAANLHTVHLEKPKPAPPVHISRLPEIYLPPSLRQGNWIGNQGEGSCAHATVVTLLRIQRQFEKAEWWRKHNGNGEWPTDLAQKFDDAGIKYAYTSKKGNVKFLEWAVKTHRGCGVTVRGAAHMVALVHLDAKWAGLVDNNDPYDVKWIPRETFISEWLNSESWAVAVIYKPAPPLPARLDK